MVYSWQEAEARFIPTQHPLRGAWGEAAFRKSREPVGAQLGLTSASVGT